MTQLQAPSGMVQEALENPILGSHPWTRKPLREARFPLEKSCQWSIMNNNKRSVDTLEAFPTSPLPEGSTAKGQERFSEYDFPSGESEIMQESIQPPRLCETLPKTPSSLFLHPKQKWQLCEVIVN